MNKLEQVQKALAAARLERASLLLALRRAEEAIERYEQEQGALEAAAALLGGPGLPTPVARLEGTSALEKEFGLGLGRK